ncbi:hypothetical protein AA0473_2392 [Acetobacter orleanensis NRIC 0473]|uniref:DUF3429 domain-containing protein n=1 Tax=Acetobacter orleanensis TaxID=104099 RepID=A0A4Y3TFN2_9PROT|nr:hypothetical protein Abol_024_010 [Acetobacter orleanensis JCM 7639]GBR30895.1 hypothetical protein AA0473_2392 [Acetobacter orleanensis NRIC 0473]GEB81721.1 hypothetical protein AOR01nite_01980 [Acetobacter orleanensis]
MAVVLALAGLLPFLLCTCGIVFFASGVPVPNLMMAFVFYGAMSLGFYGAVHWGLALEPAPVIVTTGADHTNRLRLALGVVPAFAGWVAAYTAFAWMPVAGVAILALAVPLLYLLERQGWRTGALPSGYMGLRLIVSAVTECCLLVVLVARLF